MTIQAEQYSRRKTQSRDIGNRLTWHGQNIGPIPPPKNPERRAAGLGALLTFLSSYFPHRFTLPFCADHLELVAGIQRAILEGGRDAFAMPRGSGKTSIVECACLWAMFGGHHPFTLLIGSSREHALEMIASIKEELMAPGALADDF